MNRTNSANLELPLSFRQEDVKEIMRVLKAGDSFSIIGLSGMGKSNLFHFLLRPDVLRYYLKENAEQFLFLPLDSHAITELNEITIYELLFESLKNALENNPSGKPALVQIRESRHEEVVDSPTSQGVKALTRAFHLCATGYKFRLVLLMDQFDELYAELNPRFFVKLRALRDENKYHVSFVVFTRDDLRAIRNDKELDEFYELFQPNVWAIKPYNVDDAHFEIHRITSRYRFTLDQRLADCLIKLTGGHPGLLKASCMSMIKVSNLVEIPYDPQQLIHYLLAYQDVKYECRKLFESLRLDEVKGLRALFVENFPYMDQDVSERLRFKGILLTEGRVFSPVLEIYLREHFARSTTDTMIQAGPIRLDASGDVWVNGAKLSPPLTVSEQALLTYFCGKVNQLCTKDEIIVAVYPDKYASGIGISDEALTALIQRLRKRIEEIPSDPRFIITIRGKGYMLRV